MSQYRSTVIADANGGRTIILLRSTAGAGGIQGGILNCSTGDYLQYWESAVTNNGAPAPPGGGYQQVTLQAILYFACADGTVAQVVIPAPALGIFLADGDTVDPANAFVAGLITACVGNLESASASQATAYLGGRLSARRAAPL